MRRIAVSCTLAMSLVVATILFLSGCSGKSGSSMSSAPAVNVTVSDAATCSGRKGRTVTFL
jgi:PBP1b-binding outer membrane lipoprotein LpoB